MTFNNNISLVSSYRYSIFRFKSTGVIILQTFYIVILFSKRPDGWKMANIMSLLKIDSGNTSGNYRPFSLDAFWEEGILKSIFWRLNGYHLEKHSLMKDSQYCLRNEKSCFATFWISLRLYIIRGTNSIYLVIIFREYSGKFQINN